MNRRYERPKIGINALDKLGPEQSFCLDRTGGRGEGGSGELCFKITDWV